MHKALRMGAKFAMAMGDSSRASQYNGTANAIEQTLNGHVVNNMIVEQLPEEGGRQVCV